MAVGVVSSIGLAGATACSPQRAPSPTLGQNESSSGATSAVHESESTSTAGDASSVDGSDPEPGTGASTRAASADGGSTATSTIPGTTPATTEGQDTTDTQGTLDIEDTSDVDDPLAALQAWLEQPWDTRSPLPEAPFAGTPLTASDAEVARQWLWDDRAAFIRATREAEFDAKAIEIDGFVLRYETVILGEEPPRGRSLFISMHGGGSAPAATNDEQWRNQIALADGYLPEDALWVAPRAPTDDRNMWFKDHIDPLFDRLITNMIVFAGIDPDRVYLNGYSAGGDGVYQLAPRMADRFAAAGMSAGHPNDASPVNLRNIGFALHVGGDDSAFSRNEIALEWGAMLGTLQAADPDGYAHQVEVHPGLPHWMDLADRISIPFMQGFTRNLATPKVVWHQPAVPQSRFYWLRVSPAHEAAGTSIEASIDGQSVHIQTTDPAEVMVRLSDAMLDLDAPVEVIVNGVSVEQVTVSRTIGVLYQTLNEREDPRAMVPAEVTVRIELDA